MRACGTQAFSPPLPLQVLGEAKGRLSTLEERARQVSRAVFPRTTTQYGCVTLHRYHFSVEAGVPKPRVVLGVDGEPGRAGLDHVVLAPDQGRYAWRQQTGTAMRDGVLYPMRFASLQGTRLPGTPQGSLRV
jgi:hypothetical protein